MIESRRRRDSARRNERERILSDDFDEALLTEEQYLRFVIGVVCLDGFMGRA